uniref:DUF2281 domain-containing protein n=1 Tax=Cyanothece sp. (strain PCC 7425 / ATCC 29141) TaxID=395961 RepID=B8HJS6_CYAP4
MMTVEAEIIETVSQMPESLKQELLHYAKYLFENYSQVEAAQADVGQPKKKRGGFGILKGKIWMADDFDEPLEDLKEYM